MLYITYYESKNVMIICCRYPLCKQHIVRGRFFLKIIIVEGCDTYLATFVIMTDFAEGSRLKSFCSL